jgi:hypothetical protein
MSAPTINANAAIFLKIILMIGSFSLAHSSSVKPKQSPTFYLLKQLNNSCSQIDNFSIASMVLRNSSSGYPLWVRTGLLQCSNACPLRANSGHQHLFDHFIGATD